MTEKRMCKHCSFYNGQRIDSSAGQCCVQPPIPVSGFNAQPTQQYMNPYQYTPPVGPTIQTVPVYPNVTSHVTWETPTVYATRPACRFFMADIDSGYKLGRLWNAGWNAAINAAADICVGQEELALRLKDMLRYHKGEEPNG